MHRVHDLIASIRRADPFRGVIERRRATDARDSVSRRGLGASISRPMRTDIPFRWA